MQSNSQKTRTRLSPAARKQQILDTAQALIVEAGCINFTMDGLAEAANITTPLVYKYFSGRDELLQILLSQEYEKFANNVRTQLAGAKDFRDIVEVFISSNFDHFMPGSVLPVLQNHHEANPAHRSEQRAYRQEAAEFLVQATSKSFSFTKTEAELAVTMSSAASIAAAQFSARNKFEEESVRKEAIQTALAFVLAGLESVANRPK